MSRLGKQSAKDELIANKALEARMKTVLRSGVALDKTERTAFVRDLAGSLHDRQYQPIEALTLEVENARAALDKAQSALKAEEQELESMDEYLPKLPDGDNKDDY
ncbi:hypothetical protein [Paraglaciecola marina]|uniref:hypothetical protein n=1 Tax=Paraglaciecola marina TaxID=2500157 RepID=UPI00105F9587|nr:hypothetical protein [Paraglaciecola marina]